MALDFVNQCEVQALVVQLAFIGGGRTGCERLSKDSEMCAASGKPPQKRTEHSTTHILQQRHFRKLFSQAVWAKRKTTLNFQKFTGILSANKVAHVDSNCGSSKKYSFTEWEQVIINCCEK